MAARAYFDGFAFAEGFDGVFGPTHLLIGDLGLRIGDLKMSCREGVAGGDLSGL
jgi:hypothetical protein